MSVHIIETFVQLRKLANNYEEITIKIQQMESKYKVQFGEIYEVLQRLLEKPKKKSGKKVDIKNEYQNLIKMVLRNISQKYSLLNY